MIIIVYFQSVMYKIIMMMVFLLNCIFPLSCESGIEEVQ